MSTLVLWFCLLAPWKTENSKAEESPQEPWMHFPSRSVGKGLYVSCTSGTTAVSSYCRVRYGLTSPQPSPLRPLPRPHFPRCVCRRTSSVPHLHNLPRSSLSSTFCRLDLTHHTRTKHNTTQNETQQLTKNTLIRQDRFHGFRYEATVDPDCQFFTEVSGADLACMHRCPNVLPVCGLLRW